MTAAATLIKYGSQGSSPTEAFANFIAVIERESLAQAEWADAPVVSREYSPEHQVWTRRVTGKVVVR